MKSTETYRHTSGMNIADSLDKVIPGKLKVGRNLIGGHAVDVKDGSPEEGLDMQGVDLAAASGAIKHLRGLGFPVKRHNDHEFTIGGAFAAKAQARPQLEAPLADASGCRF